MKRILIFIALFQLYSTGLLAQSYFGIGVSAQSDRIVDISKDTKDQILFSGADLEQNINFTMIPHLHFRRIINDRFSFQTGLSYSRTKRNLSYSYYDTFFTSDVADTLKIKLNYLTIPLRVNYLLSKKSSNSLHLGFSANTNILVESGDNFDAINPYEIAFLGNRYARLTATPQLSLVYEKILGTESYLDIELNIKRDVTKYLSSGGSGGSSWGPWANFRPSRLQTYSLGVHYYF